MRKKDGMMKKNLLVLVGMILSLVAWAMPVVAQEQEDLLTMTQKAGYPATVEMLPKASIVLDAESGQVLWGDNIDLKWDPASTTKTMVIYLTFEAISQGKISLDTPVIATETDQAIAGIYALSNNKIVAGETYTVRELLTTTLVPSSNVTTLMLAHLIHDGDDASFLQLMNDTAKELGMTNTHFYNATGAVSGAFQGYYAPIGSEPTASNEVTAKDLAILAYHLIKKHPDVLEYTNSTSVSIKSGTPLAETFEAYNYSLPGAKYGIEGVDGLKTGSSPQAGFNSIVTAKRGDTRLITVVLGVGNWADQDGEYYRHYFVNTLLEHTFATYKRQIVAPAGQQEVNGQQYMTDQDLYAMVKENEHPQLLVANDHLQVAGSLDPMSGVAVKSVDTKVTDKKTGLLLPKGSEKKEGSIFAGIPMLVYLLLPVLLIVVIVGVLLSRGGRRRKKVHVESSRSYSRRNRRRR